MMQIGYRVAERFSPTHSAIWAKYIEWSGFTHLAEIVGLDCSLSPPLPDEHVEEDYPQLVLNDRLTKCFGDLRYLLDRTAAAYDPDWHQVLAVARLPAAGDAERFRLPGFRFLGYELLDEDTEISALTNCGFGPAFDLPDMSTSGLIVSASRAYAIRDSIERLFPDNPHSVSTVWAVWRRESA